MENLISELNTKYNSLGINFQFLNYMENNYREQRIDIEITPKNPDAEFQPIALENPSSPQPSYTIINYK